MIPRLHVVTDDRVLRAPGFPDRAEALLQAHGSKLALHVRGHGTSGANIFALADRLVPMAAATGSLILVNDRVDVGLAVACGAQLGRRSLPVAVARRLMGREAVIGYSAHGGDEARAAMDDGADFVLLGTVWPSPSHPDGETLGPDALAGLVRSWGGATPVIAIGGVTPARAAETLRAGAHGVAVLSGVWSAGEPERAAEMYLNAMEEVG